MLREVKTVIRRSWGMLMAGTLKRHWTVSSMANEARARTPATERDCVARNGWRLDRYFTGVITAIDCYFNAIDPSGISACQKHRKPRNVLRLTGSATFPHDIVILRRAEHSSEAW